MAPISYRHLATQQGAQGPHAPGVATVVGRLGRVAAVIAKELAHAALRDRLGYAGGINVTGDEVKKLDIWGHEVVEAALRATGACAAFVSEEAKEPIEMTTEGANPLVVCCDPVDGRRPRLNGRWKHLLAAPSGGGAGGTRRSVPDVRGRRH